MDAIRNADWIIDLGPEGGDRGGEVVVCGTPRQVATCDRFHTGRFLRPIFDAASHASLHTPSGEPPENNCVHLINDKAHHG